jgi:hypothetical protein
MLTTTPAPTPTTAIPRRSPLGRKLRTPALVFAALLGFDFLIAANRDRWERYSPDDYAERVRGCAASPRDFVVVGGSPVAEGIDPDRIGPNGYAIGLSGGTTTDMYYALTHACPTPPRVLVYGVSVSDMNDSRNEPHGPHSLMTWGDLAECVRTRPDVAEWETRHFLQARLGRCWAAFRYRHGIRMWAAATADEAFPGSFPASAKEARDGRTLSESLRTGSGYVPTAGFAFRQYDNVKATNAPQPPFGFLDKYRTGSHLKYVDKMLDWAGERGSEIVLVEMPVTADLEAKYAAAVAEFRTRLAEIEARRRVRIVRATRDAVGLTDADFADLIHLNHVGARKLSTWVAGEVFKSRERQ